VALSHLIKHIYNNATDEVIRRGKKIHATGSVELIEFDELMGNVVFRVKDDSYSTFYKVHINKFKDVNAMGLRCSCPYNLSDVCRHKAGALLALQDMLDRNMLRMEDMAYNQKHTVVKMKAIELKTIRMMAAPQSMTDAEEFLRVGSANIEVARDEMVKASIQLNGEDFNIVIRKNEERNFDTSCNCSSDSRHPLCLHKVILLLQLLNNHGIGYFDSIRNWDNDKNKLLALYGYSLSDDLTGKFEFQYKDNKPFLRVLDPSIKRVANPVVSDAPKPSWREEEKAKPEEEKPVKEAAVPAKAMLKLGVVLVEDNNGYPFFTVEAVQGETNEQLEFLGKVEKLDLSKFIDTENFDENDKMQVQNVRKLLPAEVSKYLNRNSPFSGIWENIVTSKEDALPFETRMLMVEYLLPKLRRLLEEMQDSKLTYYLPAKKAFNTKNLQPVHFSHDLAKPGFSVDVDGDKYTIYCNVKIGYQTVPLEENEVETNLIFKHGDSLHTWEKIEDLSAIEKFYPKGKMELNKAEWSEQLQQLILPLSKEYSVDFGNVVHQEVRDMKPERKIFLREKGDYLLFIPVFTYGNYEIRPNDKERIIIPQGDKLLIISRDLNAEQDFVNKIQALHSQFVQPEENYTLALKGMDVLKNNWFFLFVDAMKEQQVPVFGFEQLRNFRFNTAKPTTKIWINSNTDWFDAKVDIEFGEQKVTVADVKNALANKQQFVQLADGTLGILPEEWLKKYSLLFRVGEGKNDKMKISKYHFGVIDELYENRREDELMFQLEEKYENLRRSHDIKKIEAPSHLMPILRPYQVSGFQWLNYLSEVQWGGILADDMGLGKTIQALSFLHHHRTSHQQLQALVVCPTTLMYNWENEIKKFTPGLTYVIHHGGFRTRQHAELQQKDVIITTYGTLRSDIKLFLEIPFDYVVLDESQAIKNPSSKVTKAACLLKARTRLCLSGTPLQNNTFDIFAQMNFLNPGMLGSIEHFKTEFAVPIDKFGEPDRKEHLRKILYPFILRRTKEQVAKDLPPKTEMVLWCEMGDEQRKIYDAFRNDYRDKILGVVETQGINKSQLTILQGLMKLRQICDSPAIMNEQERYPNESIKLDELTREITENISNHKALVFSQFLGMLALIKERLVKEGVSFEYFDGSTSAPDREKAIQNFQNNDECRVFLISLKAGGVGLNLTAADYVYIVDPWWNPAVEQQAIDRTHRIGQTKNIFAYRMICRDSIEDKIIQLQERKRLLAKDLIADDNNFVKSLSREDIEYLFS
jgi:SNF2 family DNA or RNA helicase